MTTIEALIVAQQQRDALLAAIKPLLYSPATTRERRNIEIANAAIAFAEGNAPLTRELASRIAKAEGE